MAESQSHIQYVRRRPVYSRRRRDAQTTVAAAGLTGNKIAARGYEDSVGTRA